MASRNELNARARVLGIDPSSYANDSKLEQKVLWAEKNATAFTGTLATGTLTSDATAQSDGDEVVIGDVTYTFKTALSEAKATQTLTVSGVFSDGELVVVDGRTYVMRTALSSPEVEDEVLIGAAALNSLDNLKSAINLTGTAGTDYSSITTAHPRVTATTNTDTTQVVEFNSLGVVGNAALVSTDGANASWGASALAGGVDPVPNEVLLGAAAANMLDNLKSAINDSGTEGTHYGTGTVAHPQVTAGTNTDTTQEVTAVDYSVTNASIATTDPTDTGSHMSWGAATLASGVADVNAVAGAGTRDTNAGIHGDKNL